MSNPQVNSITVKPNSDKLDETWDHMPEMCGAKTAGGSKRAIGKICCEWNAYFGVYDFVIFRDHTGFEVYGKQVEEKTMNISYRAGYCEAGHYSHYEIMIDGKKGFGLFYPSLLDDMSEGVSGLFGGTEYTGDSIDDIIEQLQGAASHEYYI